jgi:translation initiation factor IF-3
MTRSAPLHFHQRTATGAAETATIQQGRRNQETKQEKNKPKYSQESIFTMNRFSRILLRQQPCIARMTTTVSVLHSSDVLAILVHKRQMHCRRSSSSVGLYSDSRSIRPPMSMCNLIASSLHREPTYYINNSTSLQVRRLATNRKPSKSKKDDNAPLLNEHLIAELLQKKQPSGGNITADSFEVRLIVDLGRTGKKDVDDEENQAQTTTPTTQIVTIKEAISIAHNHSLDLMEVSLKGEPPVIKALDFDKFLYQQKRKESKSKSKDGGGSISDKPVKEFKFRAGIADHDLERKATNMINYLTKGHAVRVTLTARQRMLKEDTDAINTTLDRVKELVGDKAVEVRGMKSNERGSYGTLLLHPNLKK